MKKYITLFLFLCICHPSHASTASIGVHFDSVKKAWNPSGVSIQDMPYIGVMLSVGKMSFAFGCKEQSASCDLKRGFVPLVSFNNGSGWSPASNVQNMDPLFASLLLPVSPENPDNPAAWLIGHGTVSRLAVSYFDGRNFSPAKPAPINYPPNYFSAYPFIVAQHQLWAFDVDSGRVFRAVNTDWYPVQSTGIRNLSQITVDASTSTLYILNGSGLIKHLLPDYIWSEPIYVPPLGASTEFSDIRVMDAGRIMAVMAIVNGGSHILISQDNGKNWLDTGLAGSVNADLPNFLSILNGNGKNIFWQFYENTLRYLDPSATNPAWKSALLPDNLKSPGQLNYRLTTSLDGTQAWMYGYDVNNKLVAFYYDLTLMKYINTSLDNVADKIYTLEASGDGKAFAYGSYQSNPVGLYFDGVQWNRTFLIGFETNLTAVKQSYLPFGWGGYFSADSPFKQIVDPAYSNVWLFNLGSP